MIAVIIWWLIVQFFGWLALPATFRIFRWLPDRGYAFSKALGLLLVSYLLWLGSVTGFLHNSRGGILAAILVTAGISTWLYLRYPRRRPADEPTLRQFLRERLGMVITVETLFTLAFVLWVVLRAYASFKIDTAGGEKFMEVAFQNAILRSIHFPPVDPWLSGFSISYYYFGYVMMAMMTRLSGAPVGVAFDLYDSMLFALTLVGAFGVVYNLIPAARRTRTGRPAFGSGQPIRYALLGALLLGVMGNLSGFFESVYSSGLVSDSFWKWLDQPSMLAQGVKTGTFVPSDNGWFWWWRGSRVVFDRDLLGKNDAGNPNITEFPFFSFLLGDNHPHVLGLPFVLMAIGLGLNLLRRQLSKKEGDGDTEQGGETTKEGDWTTKDAKEGGWTTKDAKEDAKSAKEEAKDAGEGDWITKEEAKGAKGAPWWDPVGTCLDGDWALFVIMALCLGALGFLNTWDFPIYLTLVTLAYGIGLYAVKPAGSGRRLDGDLLRRALTLGIGLGLLGVLLYILFYLGFSSQASGIMPFVFPPTELRQYFVMFGPFLVILTIFLVVILVRNARQHGLQVLLKTLVAWLATAVGLLVLYAVILLVVSLLDMVLHFTNNAVVRQALSNLSVASAMSKALSWRLRDPWVLLWLSGLLTLAVANLILYVKAAVPVEAGQVKVDPVRAGAVEAGLKGRTYMPDQESSAEVSLQEDDKTRRDQSEESASVEAPSPNFVENRPDDRRAETRPGSPERQRLSPSLLFVMLLVFLGVALTLSVEFVYLRDVFNTRMNTMFKFYFEGWAMMSCASAYGLWWLFNRGDKVTGPAVKYSIMSVAGILILAGMFYPLLAFNDRVNGFKGFKPNLDGTSVLAQRNPDDWAAIRWLNENVSGTPTILEAPGHSYNYEGRISALTGLPAVLGWALHEEQWRGNYIEQGKREPDIAAIYTSNDPKQTLDLLHKWNVSYVILGDTERTYIRSLCEAPGSGCNSNTASHKFDGLLTPVFTGSTTTIYAVP